MKLTKKLPKWAIVTICVLGFAALYTAYYIVLGNARQLSQTLKEQNDLRNAYEIHVAETAKGDLHDDFFLRRIDNIVVDFTDEETEKLLEAFDMTIPENEPNAKPRLLAVDDDCYYLEFDGITDRKAFYDVNKIDRKRYFKFDSNWDSVDDNGEYTHYFAVRVQFKSGSEELKSSYAARIEPLYKEMLAEHLKRFKEQL